MMRKTIISYFWVSSSSSSPVISLILIAFSSLETVVRFIIIVLYSGYLLYFSLIVYIIFRTIFCRFSLVSNFFRFSVDILLVFIFYRDMQYSKMIILHQTCLRKAGVRGTGYWGAGKMDPGKVKLQSGSHCCSLTPP